MGLDKSIHVLARWVSSVNENSKYDCYGCYPMPRRMKKEKKITANKMAVFNLSLSCGNKHFLKYFPSGYI